MSADKKIKTGEEAAVIPDVVELDGKYSKFSLYKDAWKRLRRNMLAMLGLAIVICMVLLAIFEPLLAPGEI